MRWLDRWLGILFCFLLTAINHFARLRAIIKKENNRPPKKLLFIKLSEMGAIILAYPLLRQINKEYPGAELFFLTFSKNKEVFAALGNIVSAERVLTIDESSVLSFMRDTLSVIKKTRKGRIDIVFDLEFFSRFSAILSYLSGAVKKIGFYRYRLEGLYRGGLLTHNLQYNLLLHISSSYLAMAGVAAQKSKRTPELEGKITQEKIILPQFVPQEQDMQNIKDKIKGRGLDEGSKVFLIGAGEGVLPLREWPLENFIVLCKKILEDEKNHIVLIGTEGARARAGLLYSAINNKRCLNLSGQTCLRELLCLFLLSRALIANDCGLAHLASLTPIKKFIIFGPESPQVFGPLGENNYIIYAGLACSPCLSAFNHRSSSCTDNKCLKAIGASEIYDLMMRKI